MFNDFPSQNRRTNLNEPDLAPLHTYLIIITKLNCAEETHDISSLATGPGLVLEMIARGPDKSLTL